MSASNPTGWIARACSESLLPAPHLVSVSRTRCIASKASFASFHEVLGPFVIDALGDAFTAAELNNAIFPAQAAQHDADLLF
jgi:hypothetical protein|tara:strand:- start:94 stop:339 length:246 start_codon:yes stop_codon:yes gene_type:complete